MFQFKFFFWDIYKNSLWCEFSSVWYLSFCSSGMCLMRQPRKLTAGETHSQTSEEVNRKRGKDQRKHCRICNTESHWTVDWNQDRRQNRLRKENWQMWVLSNSVLLVIILVFCFCFKNILVHIYLLLKPACFCLFVCFEFRNLFGTLRRKKHDHKIETDLGHHRKVFLLSREKDFFQNLETTMLLNFIHTGQKVFRNRQIDTHM